MSDVEEGSSSPAALDLLDDAVLVLDGHVPACEGHHLATNRAVVRVQIRALHLQKNIRRHQWHQ